MKTLNWQDFNALIQGAAFFASGGGGSKNLALQYLNEHVSPDSTVTLLNVDEMTQSQHTTFVAEVYAPGSYIDQEPDLRGGENAFTDYQHLIPASQTCGVSPAETGATSVLLTLLVGIHQHTFIVDTASALRSIAELGMTVFAADNIDTGQFTLASGGSYANHFTQTLPSSNANDAMKAITNTINQYPDHYHNAAGFAIYGMDSTALKKVSNLPKDVLQAALKIGQYACLPPTQAYEKIIHVLPTLTQRAAFQLFTGRLHKIQLNYDKTSNQTIGHIEFKSANNDHEFVKVYAVNENVMAMYEFHVSQKVVLSRPLCIGPDAINYLLMEDTFASSITFSNSDIVANPTFFKGKMLSLIGLAMPELRSESVIDTFKEKIQQAMGTDTPITYIPVEILNQPALKQPVEPLEPCEKISLNCLKTVSRGS